MTDYIDFWIRDREHLPTLKMKQQRNETSKTGQTIM